MHIHLAQITYRMHVKGDFQPSLVYIQYIIISSETAFTMHSLTNDKKKSDSEAFWEEQCDMLTQGDSVISA